VPILVQLRTERGGVVGGLPDPAGGTFDAAGDFDRLLERAGDSALQLLRYVDPYGDTEFNHLQMEDLLVDIATIAGLGDLKPVKARGLDRLRVLAERCKVSANLYLWFVGD
jgi:hypothetical protein